MEKKRAKKLANFATNLLSFIFWALVLFGFNTPYVAILTFISAIIHECGHLAALLFTANYNGMPRFSVSGMRLHAKSGISYQDELLILIAGPVANVLAFIFFYVLSLLFGRYFFIFAILNMFTAISNLLPVKGYDGYKIINTLICMRGLGIGFHRALSALSFTFVVVLTFLSLYLIMKVGDGYWIFGIFFVSLLISLDKTKNNKKRVFKRFQEKKRVF